MSNETIIKYLNDHDVDHKIVNDRLMAHTGYNADRSEWWEDITGYNGEQLREYLGYDPIEMQ